MEEREYEIKKKWDYIMKDPMLSISGIKKKAFDGILADKGLRSLCWKIYLDYIPNLETSSWQIKLNKERQHYEDLKNKFIFDPNKANKEEANWNVNNPLSLEDESPWKQYFENTELQKTIRQDVERTFPDIEFFRNDTVQNLLCNILFVYCKLNQDISYRQGMHEILAPIFMVVDTDKIDASSTILKDDLIKTVLNSRYVEHDSFFLFCQVMKSAKSWYEFNESLTTAPDSTKEKYIVPIVAKCQRIQNEMLKVVDNELYLALKRHEIEPQLYGLRWLRLLFSREFPMEDVLILWDGLFAEGNNLELVDWIVLVMLIQIRDKIIDQEYSVCLTYLMKYPRLEGDRAIVHLVEKARRIKTHWVEIVSRQGQTSPSSLGQGHGPDHSVPTSSAHSSAKLNKFQSMMRSADKRLSWTSYDPLKLGRNSSKSSSTTTTTSSVYRTPEDRIGSGSGSGSGSGLGSYAYDPVKPLPPSQLARLPSLSEKQLQEENSQLKAKVKGYETVLSTAQQHLRQCMKLMQDMQHHYLEVMAEDMISTSDHPERTATPLHQEQEQLMLKMNELQHILTNDTPEASTPTSTTPSSKKTTTSMKPLPKIHPGGKLGLMEEPEVYHEGSEKEKEKEKEKKSVVVDPRTSSSPTHAMTATTTTTTTPSSANASPIQPLTSSSSSSSSSSKEKEEKKEKEKKDNTSSSSWTPSSSTSTSTSSPSTTSTTATSSSSSSSSFHSPAVASKLTEASLPVIASVVTATATSTISSPKKEIFRRHSSTNDYALDTYKEEVPSTLPTSTSMNMNNVWNDPDSTLPYSLDTDPQHSPLDDIRLQVSGFSFNPTPAATLGAATLPTSSTTPTDFSMNNPWEDPWKMKTPTTTTTTTMTTTTVTPSIHPYSSLPPHSEDTLKPSPLSTNLDHPNLSSPSPSEKFISPSSSSLHFNPFDSPTLSLAHPTNNNNNNNNNANPNNNNNNQSLETTPNNNNNNNNNEVNNNNNHNHNHNTIHEASTLASAPPPPLAPLSTTTTTKSNVKTSEPQDPGHGSYGAPPPPGTSFSSSHTSPISSSTFTTTTPTSARKWSLTQTLTQTQTKSQKSPVEAAAIEKRIQENKNILFDGLGRGGGGENEDGIGLGGRKNHDHDHDHEHDSFRSSLYSPHPHPYSSSSSSFTTRWSPRLYPELGSPTTTSTTTPHGNTGLFHDTEEEKDPSEGIFEFIRQAKAKQQQQLKQRQQQQQQRQQNHPYPYSYSHSYQSPSQPPSQPPPSSLLSSSQSPSKSHPTSPSSSSSPPSSMVSPSTTSPTTPSPSKSKSKSTSSSSWTVKPATLSTLSSSYDYKNRTTTYVDYDPLLSPQLKPGSVASTSASSRRKGSSPQNSTTPTPTPTLHPTYASPVRPSLTPTLTASTTTTLAPVHVKASGSGSRPGSRSGSILEVVSGDGAGALALLEEATATTVPTTSSSGTLGTSGTSKPVLLDPLGAGVVHTFEF